MRTSTANDPIPIILADETRDNSTAGRASATHAQHRVAPREDRTQYAALSDREREVLVLVAEGYSATEIGEQLLISPKTVETYKQRVSEKLALHRRSEYVQFCLRLDLLHAHPQKDLVSLSASPDHPDWSVP